jgi:hypothetical protein
VPWDKSQAPPAILFHERQKDAFLTLRVASPHKAKKGIGRACRQAASTADRANQECGRRLLSFLRLPADQPTELRRLLMSAPCSCAALKNEKVSAVHVGKPPAPPIHSILTGAAETFASPVPSVAMFRSLRFRSLRSLQLRLHNAPSAGKSKDSGDAPCMKRGVCFADGGSAN